MRSEPPGWPLAIFHISSARRASSVGLTARSPLVLVGPISLDETAFVMRIADDVSQSCHLRALSSPGRSPEPARKRTITCERSSGSSSTRHASSVSVRARPSRVTRRGRRTPLTGFLVRYPHSTARSITPCKIAKHWRTVLDASVAESEELSSEHRSRVIKANLDRPNTGDRCVPKRV